MIVAAHTAAGGFLGRLMNPDSGRKWTLTIFLAAGSHILLDYLPQIGYTFDLYLRLIDLTGAVLIMLLMIKLVDFKKPVLIAGVAAAAPDIEHLLVDHTDIMSERIFISHWDSFERIELSWQWGLAVEAGVIILALTGIYLIERA